MAITAGSRRDREVRCGHGHDPVVTAGSPASVDQPAQACYLEDSRAYQVQYIVARQTTSVLIDVPSGRCPYETVSTLGLNLTDGSR